MDDTNSVLGEIDLKLEEDALSNNFELTNHSCLRIMGKKSILILR